MREELPPALRATSLNDGGFINFVHKLFIHSKTLYIKYDFCFINIPESRCLPFPVFSVKAAVSYGFKEVI